MPDDNELPLIATRGTIRELVDDSRRDERKRIIETRLCEHALKIAALKPVIEKTMQRAAERTEAVYIALCGSFAEKSIGRDLKELSGADPLEVSDNRIAAIKWFVDYDFFVVGDKIEDSDKPKFDLDTLDTVFPMDILDGIARVYPQFKKADCHVDARYTQASMKAELNEVLKLIERIELDDDSARKELKSKGHISDLVWKNRGVSFYVRDSIDPEIMEGFNQIKKRVGYRSAWDWKEYENRVWKPAARLVKENYLGQLDRLSTEHPSLKPAYEAIASV